MTICNRVGTCPLLKSFKGSVENTAAKIPTVFHEVNPQMQRKTVLCSKVIGNAQSLSLKMLQKIRLFRFPFSKPTSFGNFWGRLHKSQRLSSLRASQVVRSRRSSQMSKSRRSKRCQRSKQLAGWVFFSWRFCFLYKKNRETCVKMPSLCFFNVVFWGCVVFVPLPFLLFFGCVVLNVLLQVLVLLLATWPPPMAKCSLLCCFLLSFLQLVVWFTKKYTQNQNTQNQNTFYTTSEIFFGLSAEFCCRPSICSTPTGVVRSTRKSWRWRKDGEKVGWLRGLGRLGVGLTWKKMGKMLGVNG